MIEQYGLGIFVVLFFDIMKEHRKFKKEFEQAKKRWRDL